MMNQINQKTKRVMSNNPKYKKGDIVYYVDGVNNILSLKLTSDATVIYDSFYYYYKTDNSRISPMLMGLPLIQESKVYSKHELSIFINTFIEKYENVIHTNLEIKDGLIPYLLKKMNGNVLDVKSILKDINIDVSLVKEYGIVELGIDRFKFYFNPDRSSKATIIDFHYKNGKYMYNQHVDYTLPNIENTQLLEELYLLNGNLIMKYPIELIECSHTTTTFKYGDITFFIPSNILLNNFGIEVYKLSKDEKYKLFLNGDYAIEQYKTIDFDYGLVNIEKI